MPPTLFDTRQMADRLEVRYADVLAWARDGEIPAIKVSGRYFFDLAKVVKALNRRTTAAPELEGAAR